MLTGANTVLRAETRTTGLHTYLTSLVDRRKKVFSLFVTAGVPHPEQTIELIEAAVCAGADLIELGIPFSDPIADGPVIQRSSELALGHGMTLRKTLDMAGALTKRIDVPVVLMGYINPVLAFGLDGFIRRCVDEGVSGLIFPDMPPEESDEYMRLAREHHIATIFLASPTTPAERLRLLDERSNGFLYLVSVAGVTGARSHLADEACTFIQSARDVVHRNPMLVGFGIATPEDARRVAQLSDGIIVGSAFLKAILDAPAPPWRAALDLISSIRTSLDTFEVP